MENIDLVKSITQVEDNSAPRLPGKAEAKLDTELSNDFKAKSKAVLINISEMIMNKIATDDFDIKLENSMHLLVFVKKIFNL
jgi:hypothetical protein